VLLAVALLSQPMRLIGTDMVMWDHVLITAGVATVVATHRDRVLRRGQEESRRVADAVTDERLRIARELHDVLAHNLTLVNAQAGVAEYLLESDPAGAATALRGITKHTGRAIEELRVTVGLLRREEHDPHAATVPQSAHDLSGQDLRPVPGLDALDELVAAFRAAGTAVTVTHVGPPSALDEQSDLAAYRIVAEAVTNAHKHAPRAPVSVTLARVPDHLGLLVSNPTAPPEPADGPHRTARTPPGTGNGLIGMRERALACGGTFTAGASGGRFVVEATLPTPDVAS